MSAPARRVALESLRAELIYLRNLRQPVRSRAAELGAGSLVHEELPLALRTLRDELSRDVASSCAGAARVALQPPGDAPIVAGIMPAAAAIQMTSGPDVAANLADARALLEAAAARGAQLAVLPENFAFMGLADADKRRIAEADGAGPVQDFLAQTARRLEIWIVAGTVPLSGAADGRVAAASLVYDCAGERRARYDKIHLFDVELPGARESYRESAHVAPGAAPIVLETPFGRLGLSVCYDVRFPELYRSLSAAGAELLTVPSAFTEPTGRAHWESLLRARAIENLCCVIAPAQSGFHPGGRETHGDSMIVDHWGRVLDRLPRGTGCVVAQLDLERQRRERAIFPALEHRALSADTHPRVYE